MFSQLLGGRLVGRSAKRGRAKLRRRAIDQASRRWRAGHDWAEMRRVDLCTGRHDATWIIIGAGGAMGGSR